MASKAIGKLTITDLSTAVGLGTLPAGTKYATIQADSQSIRYWLDGSTPTATEGILLAAGQSVTVGGRLVNLLMIQTTASAKVQVQFLGS